MATLIFLHGLNTYGDDDLHIGPVRFGAMHSRLEKEFRSRGINFVAITGLGAGSPEAQAERALAKIREIGTLSNSPNSKLFLLGQSTGGLVARVLATRAEFAGQVRGLITMGTPHLGTIAAQFGLEFATQYPTLARIFSSFGYDTRAKSQIFSHFTPERMREFNERYPARDEIREISLVCSAPRAMVSWPLQVFYNRLHSGLDAGPSDGFVSVKSQERGEVKGPYAIDHFGELGFFFQIKASMRRSAKQEFERLVEDVTALVSK